MGHTVAESWDALVNGRNGIAPITRFNTEDSKYKLAGEVKDFNPADYFDKSTARKTDLFVQFALVAADEAVKDADIIGNVDADRLAVYFGSGIGGFNDYQP